MGETAGQGGRDILTASASCSRCTVQRGWSPAPLTSATSPCFMGSVLTDWSSSGTPPCPGRVCSRAPGSLWGRKRGWISCPWCSACPCLRQVSAHSSVPLPKGLTSGICSNLQSKGTKHHRVDILCAIQELSTACWRPRVFLFSSHSVSSAVQSRSLITRQWLPLKLLVLT